LSERQPHVNVIWRNVIMPSREAVLGAGDHGWATAVFGSTGACNRKGDFGGAAHVRWKSRRGRGDVAGKAALEVELSEPTGPLKIVKGGRHCLVGPGD